MKTSAERNWLPESSRWTPCRCALPQCFDTAAPTHFAPQLNIFSLCFPVTLGVGLVGALPMLQRPFAVAPEQMLARF